MDRNLLLNLEPGQILVVYKCSGKIGKVYNQSNLQVLDRICKAISSTEGTVIQLLERALICLKIGMGF